MRIIFFGTSNFAVPILESLKKEGYKIEMVVTSSDKPKGRKRILTPSPIKLLAQKYKIPIFQPENIENCKLKIENLKLDLAIVAAYGQIIPKEILDIPQFGCLNIHPSLLPKYRGSSPIQFAILEGEEKTGVSIITMDEKIDHGPILASRELEIRNSKHEIRKMNYKELESILAELAGKLLIEILPKYLKGDIKSQEQDHSKATYTKILKKEDGEIDFSLEIAEQIERKTRAFYLWPGTYTKLKVKSKIIRLKIIKVNLMSNTYPLPPNLRPGQFFLLNKKVAVKCKERALILEEVQPEGKRVMKGKEFLLGHKYLISNI